MRKYAHLLQGEFQRSFTHMMRYPLETGAMVFMFCLMFFMMFFFADSVTRNVAVDSMTKSELEANSARILMGYIVWLVSTGALNLMSTQLTVEAQAGTLQQLYLTPLGFTTLLIARAAVGFLFSLVVTSIIAFIILSVSGILLETDYVALFVSLVFIWIGVSGLGLIFAGLTLVLKRIQQVLALAVWGSILLTFTPLEDIPGWLTFFVKTFPFTQGMRIFRASAVDHESFVRLIVNGEIPYLVGGAIAYFIVGLWCYQRFENIARKKGVLGQY